MYVRQKRKRMHVLRGMLLFSTSFTSAHRANLSTWPVKGFSPSLSVAAYIVTQNDSIWNNARTNEDKSVEQQYKGSFFIFIGLIYFRIIYFILSLSK